VLRAGRNPDPGLPRSHPCTPFRGPDASDIPREDLQTRLARDAAAADGQRTVVPETGALRTRSPPCLPPRKATAQSIVVAFRARIRRVGRDPVLLLSRFRRITLSMRP